MNFQMSNCIALGVPDKRKAADLYTNVLGFEEVKSESNWVEMRSGSQRIFLCEDEVAVPCFDLQTADVEAAEKHLADSGFVRVDLAPGELFMKDPFGYIYCISSAVN
jgi:catechol 2,3-dioxygenase-like lactoylglutathione lyase family enzyme